MITKVTLNNFKCFATSTSIPMSQITVLYGKNGRGKSSVIQSLLLLSQSLIRNGGSLGPLLISDSVVSLGTFQDILNRNNRGFNTISFEVETDVENDNERVLHLSFHGDRQRPTIAVLDDLRVGEVSYRVSYKLADDQGASEQSVESSFLPQSDIRTYNYLRSISYVSAERRGPRNFEDRRDNLTQRDVDVKGDNLINALFKEDDDFKDRFSEELSLILSGASVRVLANENTPDRIDLFLDSTNDNSSGFRPTNVGFGYSYVLPIVFKTMIAPKDSMVIIENPEAHLYPGAQSRLLDFLVKYATRNNLQIILETHSDHIINGMRLAVKESRISAQSTSILYFDRSEDDSGTPSIESIHLNEKGALSKQPEDFMDEWTKQLMALL